MLHQLFGRRNQSSLISNGMVMDMYSQKVKYIEDATANQTLEALDSTNPAFEYKYLSCILSGAKFFSQFMSNKISDEERALNRSVDSLDMEINDIEQLPKEIRGSNAVLKSSIQFRTNDVNKVHPEEKKLIDKGIALGLGCAGTQVHKPGGQKEIIIQKTDSTPVAKETKTQIMQFNQDDEDQDHYDETDLPRNLGQLNNRKTFLESNLTPIFERTLENAPESEYTK